MGLVMEHEPAIEGYEAVPLPLAEEDAGGQGSAAAVLRRRSARPSRRAVIYVHGLGDAFVPDEIVQWFTYRGFHFYAADLREVGAEHSADSNPGQQPGMAGPPGHGGLAANGHGGLAADGHGGLAANGHAGTAASSRTGRPVDGRAGPAAGIVRDSRAAAMDLGRCFTCLDAAISHLRHAESIDTVVVCAHGTGALIAALWCHARRGSRPAEAVILASPQLGPGGPSWLARTAPSRSRGGLAWRQQPPMVAGAQRRLRRGLDIACPVLVMCPANAADSAGSGSGRLLLSQFFGAARGTVRLGQHVTWLQLEGRLPGQGALTGAAGRSYFDQLSRWLGAYLSGQLRDQLL